MASKVTTLFEDSAKTNALYPRTKVSAVSDGSGNGLDALLSNINANKQDTLASGTNIKTVNGKSLLGSGNIPSFFAIDTSNLIRSGGMSKNDTYTATEDCIVCGGLSTSGSQTHIFINGVDITRVADWDNVMFFMKAGDVLSFTGNYGLSQFCNVWGIKN